METHPITWTTPQPFWKEVVDGIETQKPAMTTPTILRFDTDDFMQRFIQILATDPQRLGEYRVVRETWRGIFSTPTVLPPKKTFALSLQRFAASRQRVNGTALANQGKKPAETDVAKSLPLKLYQPAHQRFYLVTSSLVCQQPGLPDRKIDPGKQEQAGFVLRRLLQPKSSAETDPAKWPEHAWIEKDGAHIWSPVADEEKQTWVIRNGQREELLPLFGTNYFQDDQRQRRLMAGLIPAGKREAYLAGSGGPENGSGGVTGITARKSLLRKEVIEPWKALVARAADLHAKLSEENEGETVPAFKAEASIKDLRAQIQTTSWFILLDFSRFLERYVKPVWDNLDKTPPVSGLTSAQQTLLTELRKNHVDDTAIKDELHKVDPSPPVETSLATVLRQIRNFSKFEDEETTVEVRLRNLEGRGNWPSFLFPLADPELPLAAARPSNINLTAVDPLPTQSEVAEEATELKLLEDDESSVSAGERIDKLGALIIRALDRTSDKPEPAVPLAARQPADALEGWFVIRCVYARPGCGPLHDDVVSLPTEPFQLAGFFDPDAPARPIRIGLPIDTTPGGLRKFDRNTAFVISDTLCGQISRLKGLTLGDLIRTVLPWPLHQDLSIPEKGPCKKGGASFGMICSLSIPIITICALILLMIMVSLLDIVFRWMPYFIICFPIPGLRAKPK